MSERDRLVAVLNDEVDALYAFFDGHIGIEEVAERLVAAGVTMPAPAPEGGCPKVYAQLRCLGVNGHKGKCR